MVACRDAGFQNTQQRVRAIADSVVPDLEQAVGLAFKTDPVLEVRTREQFRTYVEAKIAAELPPDELHRLTVAYRLFGLIPDTLDLEALLPALYAEQVIGFYDPDSSALYVLEGADPTILRITVLHELVHALQDQHMPLAPILSAKGQNDRRMAAQAVLEGQATLISMMQMLTGTRADAFDDVWDNAREMVRAQQDAMPVFGSAPLILREGLLFPYLGGAEFVRWFDRTFPDTVPFGPRLPASTEQILHPDRYRMADAPVSLEIAGEDDAIHVDGLGEFETGILLTELTGSELTGTAAAVGWGGDRYAVYAVDGGYGLVWWSVWDSEPAANRFARVLSREWSERPAQGRQHLVERRDVDGVPGVLFMEGPPNWAWFGDAPLASVRDARGVR
jgi:hypothetical protein